MDVKVVIFDWDGTLVDSVDHIADSLHQAATELGYPELEREAYRDIIGLGMIEALEKLYPGITREEMTAIREGYARYFFSKVTTPQNVCLRAWRTYWLTFVQRGAAARWPPARAAAAWKVLWCPAGLGRILILLAARMKPAPSPTRRCSERSSAFTALSRRKRL